MDRLGGLNLVVEPPKGVRAGHVADARHGSGRGSRVKNVAGIGSTVGGNRLGEIGLAGTQVRGAVESLDGSLAKRLVRSGLIGDLVIVGLVQNVLLHEGQDVNRPAAKILVGTPYLQ